jgi:hypothetical protein
MPVITYFVVVPFSRTEDGDFLAEAAIVVRSGEQARMTARRMIGSERGAIAFSKTGDPQLGAMATCRTISHPTRRHSGA